MKNLLVTLIAVALIVGGGSLRAQSSGDKTAQDQTEIKTSDRADLHANPCAGTWSGKIHVITDTKGAIAGSYLSPLLAILHDHWYEQIPESAVNKTGCLVVEFAILKDGRVSGLKIIETTGDESLDNAALRGIKAAEPLPALPAAFTGESISLRLSFVYNPGLEPIKHAVLQEEGPNANPPRYPSEALHKRIEGTVKLNVSVDEEGSVRSVTASQGSLVLAQAASKIVKTWHFKPAQKNGKPASDMVSLQVEFVLNGAKVTWRVVPEAP